MKYLHFCLDSIISRWRRTKSRGGEDDEWLEVEAPNNISGTVLLDGIRVTCLQLISTSTSTEEQRTKRSGRSGWTSGLCWSGLEHSDRTLHWCFVFYYCKWNYWNNPQFLSLTEQLGSISMAQTVSGTLDRDRWRHWRFLMESWHD